MQEERDGESVNRLGFLVLSVLLANNADNRMAAMDVKCLERNGVLKKVGKYRFRAFGKYNYAPLYDLYQYAQMTDDAMEDMLKK